ncbi:MAG: LysR family transcriptional regulator [Burkholderiales bacterium PBB1]|nr:MAG: LysR family transcriptional regulator [Burkholderiales bacterium PBB1]
MDLRQMRYFQVLAEELNFGRAAARLHMAQPPLTRQIQALENDLGAVLFERTPRGVLLTIAGQTLYDEVPNILSLVARARSRTEQAGQGRLGRIDVGIFGASILNVIPRVLSRFRAEHPEVELFLHTMTKAEQIEALRERRITVGFNRLVPKEPDIAVSIVLRERYLVALPASHRLCANAEVTLSDMAGEPLILYPNLPMPGLAQQVLAAFARKGLAVRVVQQVEDVLTSIALVSSGFGLCITTASAASLQLPHVAYRPLKSRSLHDIDLSCLYRRDDKSPILRQFLAVVSRFDEAPPG